jgi:hypothetical protein
MSPAVEPKFTLLVPVNVTFPTVATLIGISPESVTVLLPFVSLHLNGTGLEPPFLIVMLKLYLKGPVPVTSELP